MSSFTYLSKEGYEKIKKELHHLKTVERPDISKQIAEARDKGDLSENAEYDAAKDAQGMLEYRIAKMEETLANAKIIDDKNIDNSKVYLLSTVYIKNHNTKKDLKYKLVSEDEANHKEGKISIKSPIGSALMGKVKGDVVDAKVPAGTIKLEILDITRE
jgi:transcription elongation factor GreA